MVNARVIRAACSLFLGALGILSIIDAGLPLAAQTSSSPADDPYLARAKRILKQTPLIDGHNDLPWRIREDSVARGNVDSYDLRKHTPGHTDLDRLRKGMVGAQFWSVYIPGEWRDSGYARVQLEQIDIARELVAKYPDRLALALSAQDIRRDFKEGKIGSLLGLEGGHAIENSLGALRAYYDLGVRYMTLTHNVTLDWADAALDSAKHNGLTPFGDSVVREMNKLGMLVDLSHVSVATMSDALDATQAPVIFSHSAARAIVDVPRNVPDSILRRVTKNGGIVMVPFVTGFVSPAVFLYDESRPSMRELRQKYGNDTAAITRAVNEWRTGHPEPRATLSQVADQIEYVRRVAGVDHVGIGGDFDGITEVVQGLEDVSTYPALFAELARRGWPDGDLRKLAGENFLRVFAEAEAVAKRMQRENSTVSGR
ncbi:MAG TPA: dipeptidase [Gemmatimonadaceae bacterium]|nr:dipeptidase [Gemmatimonadaceae bacterium]